MSIPHLFRCPISLDLFTDPVTLCTGQTYDRPCIERWISSGNFTCPVTMVRLNDLSMVPNHTLSHLISQWLDQTGRAASLLDADHEHDEYLTALKQTLESHQTSWEMKIPALRQVKALSLELPSGENEGLIRFGFFPLLIEVAFMGGITWNRQRLELVELALTTMVKLLPFSDHGCLNMLKQDPKLASLLALLEQGTPLIKITLCHLLEVLLSPSSNSSFQTKELSFLIRNSGDIQRALINLIHLDHNNNNEEEEEEEEEEDDDDDEEVQVSQGGVKVMLALCSNCVDHNHHQSLEKLVQLGAVNSLVRYILRALTTDSGPGLVAAVAALDVLLEAEGGKEALLGERDGVKALVKMVFRVCDHQGSESAVNSLMGLCSGSVKAREEAVKGGVLTQLLLLLQSQCSGRAKTTARMLLKVLRTMWANDPLGTNHVG